jgi:glutaredoxin
MTDKRKVEIYSAGCSLCEEAVILVKNIACASCEVEVLDIQESAIATRAKQHGIRSVPAVVIDDNLADCCAGRGVDEYTLRAAGVGEPKL